MYNIVKEILIHYSKCNNRKGRVNHPFRFFLDSRFSSLNLMNLMKKFQFQYVMSCSSLMKPKEMMDLLKKDTNLLDIGE